MNRPTFVFLNVLRSLFHLYEYLPPARDSRHAAGQYVPLVGKLVLKRKLSTPNLMRLPIYEAPSWFELLTSIHNFPHSVRQKVKLNEINIDSFTTIFRGHDSS